MPTYDYQCTECGHTFEDTLKIADRNVPCEIPCTQKIKQTKHMSFDCGGEVKQIIVAASGFAYDNIRTKHSKQVPGWYSDKIKDLKNSKRFPNNNL